MLKSFLITVNSSYCEFFFFTTQIRSKTFNGKIAFFLDKRFDRDDVIRQTRCNFFYRWPPSTNRLPELRVDIPTPPLLNS